jgi:hypothetical protein
MLPLHPVTSPLPTCAASLSSISFALPGEYMVSPSESTPFRLCDVQLRISNRRLDLLLATDTDIRSATFATLTFTTRKNGVRGEVIGLSRSGNPHLCPVISLCNRILHAREHHADLTVPIARYYDRGRWHNVTSTNISTTLKAAVTYLGPTLGFLAADVSARPIPFEPPVRWPCFVPTLTLIVSAWSVGGAAMKCFATFTSKPNLQCVAFQHACFSMVLSFCFTIMTSPAYNFPPSEFPFMYHVSCPMLATLPSQSTMVTI